MIYRAGNPPAIEGPALTVRTRLYLVRHGEQDPATGHSRNGGLSRHGRDQADRLRTVPFSAVHHSPLTRAAQTADIVAGHLPDVARNECDFVTDRTPVPSAGQRVPCQNSSHTW
ncbi:histidine phosphatase family protein [Actinoplanes subtropicus]|uniref:histidine phosphatase family protein n=1 Tax=Actinoplanes subtropicus TaxID=543632 RepID=UPI001FE17DAF|nr:histidine phosphatase family protein [Actinoplanes subtropicus]